MQFARIVSPVDDMESGTQLNLMLVFTFEHSGADRYKPFANNPVERRAKIRIAFSMHPILRK
jgi:hypothetical protein